MSSRVAAAALVLCSCARTQEEKLPEYVKDAGTAVLSTLDRELPRLDQCYDQRVTQRSDLKGTWTLSLVVQPDGTVDDVVVTGNTPDAPLEACLKDRIERWTFPPLPVEVPVQRKVTFRQ